MRYLVSLILGALVLSPLFQGTAQARGAGAVAPPKLETTYVAFKGIKNDALARKVAAQVRAVSGVRSLAWIALRAEAKLVRTQGQAPLSALAAACRPLAVTVHALVVTRQRFAFRKQLHCNGCVIKVKRALKAVRGVKDVFVPKDRLTVLVVFDKRVATQAQLTRAMASVGYPPK